MASVSQFSEVDVSPLVLRPNIKGTTDTRCRKNNRKFLLTISNLHTNYRLETQT